jgi:hypothetical protein
MTHTSPSVVSLRFLSCSALVLAGLAALIPTAVVADPVSPLIYGIDDANDIWQINPVTSATTRVLVQPSGTSNALAYDSSRSQLFFIGQDNNLRYWAKDSGSTVGTVSGATLPTPDPNNAAYYNNAYWFFQFNSNVLNRVNLSYAGSGTSAVPSISSIDTFTIANMDLPNPGPGFNTNTFGDIAINETTGMLYASTTRGRFYSLSLAGDPTTTFTEILPPIAPSGTDNSYGLQLSFDTTFSTLYGHSYEDGSWYTVNTATGSRTLIDGLTTLPANGKGFRDLGGAAVAAVPEPSTVALAGIGIGGLAWRLFRRRRAG